MIRSRCPIRVCAVLAIGLAASVMAQEPPAEPTPEPPPLARAERIDLAAAYLRLEREFFADVPESTDELAEINTAFDRATLAFFMRFHRQAIAQINAIVRRLQTADSPPTAADEWAMSFKLTAVPSMWILDQASGEQRVRVRVQSMYEVDTPASAEAVPFTLKLVNPAGETVASAGFDLRGGADTRADLTVELEMPAGPLAAGTYGFVVGTANGRSHAGPVWPVVAHSLADVRETNAAALAAIRVKHPHLAAAVTVTEARNRLLTNELSPDRPVQSLVDLPTLVTALETEIGALADGRDPFAGARGDSWRVLGGENGDPIPMRVFVPNGDIPADGWPVVIALHGMGGDENMFMDGYGVGKIKALAAARRFIAISPATERFGKTPANFDALLATIAGQHAIDRSRVVLIGHSMGAEVVANLAGQRHASIAAACCIAGGEFSRRTEASPMLVIAGALDPIASPARLRVGVERAKQAGAAIEFRQWEHYGHTLLVGAALESAIDWLLSHPR